MILIVTAQMLTYERGGVISDLILWTSLCLCHFSIIHRRISATVSNNGLIEYGHGSNKTTPSPFIYNSMPLTISVYYYYDIDIHPSHRVKGRCNCWKHGSKRCDRVHHVGSSESVGRVRHIVILFRPTLPQALHCKASNGLLVRRHRFTV